MVTLLVLGFFLGMRHALEADHVAAVAALATRSSSRRDIIRVATVWGVGHTTALVLFGSVVLGLEATVPARVSAGFEAMVGIVLVVLGVNVLRRLRRARVHFHVHEHAGGVRHFHAHGHETARHDPQHHEHAHPRGLFGKAVLVGGLHGLAGSAALVLLSLQAIHSTSRALAYLAVFGAGSILGMVLFALVITLPLRAATRLPQWAANGIEAVVGFGSITVGLWIAVHAW